jgi:hypothetical protein
MSAIENWLTENDERLVEIARRWVVVPDVVHLAAVLVLAGFTDAQIQAQLEVLNLRLRDGHDPLAGLSEVLRQVRELAATTNFDHIEVGSGGPLEATGPTRWTAFQAPAVPKNPGTKNGRSQMARCEVCGNNYDKTLQVLTATGTHTFDSLECAIHRLAPTCGHCGRRVVGHGVEAGDVVYCCANCALTAGVVGARDHVWRRAGRHHL